MKKSVTFFLIILALGLVGCKSQQVKNVEALIDNIGAVSIYSEEAIKTADKEFSYLSDADKDRVKNYTDLMRAKDDYADVVEYYFTGTWFAKVNNEISDQDEYSYIDLEKEGRGKIYSVINGEESEVPVEITWQVSDGYLKIQVGLFGISQEYPLRIDYSNSVLIDETTGTTYYFAQQSSTP